MRQFRVQFDINTNKWVAQYKSWLLWHTFKKCMILSESIFSRDYEFKTRYEAVEYVFSQTKENEKPQVKYTVDI